ncbi:LOW QUALITY PROTEIN: zinc finger and SCAN domain-containing protein 5B-like [Hipposideros larvatus]
MAADQTSSWGCGKFQDSPGWELPESLPPPGFNVTDKQDCTSETWHVAFRAFASSEEADPIKDLQRLRELCHLWLRPDIHTKEQILDKLVMEQFMISMPLELQVLVKESGVESCQDLEDMLRNNEKSEKWTVVSLQGQKFLVRSSDVQMAQAEVSDMDSIRDMSMKAWSSGSDMEIHPENSPEVLRELQNLPTINEMSREQGQKVLLPESVPGKGDLEGLRLTQNLKKDLMEDGEVMTMGLTRREPQPPKGPGEYGNWDFRGVSDCSQAEDSVRAESGKNPQEATCIKNVDPHLPSTCVLDTDVLTQSWKRRDSQSPRKKQANTSIPQEVPQEGATLLITEKFSRQLRSSSGPSPSSMGPTGRPVGKKARRGASYECGPCKKKFQYKSQLSIHQRKHTGERPFKCTLCLKGFVQSSDLRAHQRIHTGEKPYSCRFCLKQFTHDSTLRSHERVHTNEKPYQCEVCDKHFNHKGNLNVHLRTHSGAKPYPCDQCDQAFRQLGTFKRHQKTHLKVTSPNSA